MSVLRSGLFAKPVSRIPLQEETDITNFAKADKSFDNFYKKSSTFYEKCLYLPFDRRELILIGMGT